MTGFGFLPTRRTVLVSAASARQLFHPCTADFIRDVCHAHCCESSTAPSGIIVSIHKTEVKKIEARGGVVVNGLLQQTVPGCKKCPFKTPADMCGLHGTGDKPFGCIVSPFTINSNGTLIVRNRYRVLRCFKTETGKVPAYVAHRGSLDKIFGPVEAARICTHLAAGGGDIRADISEWNYQMIMDNDAVKRALKEAK